MARALRSIKGARVPVVRVRRLHAFRRGLTGEKMPPPVRHEPAAADAGRKDQANDRAGGGSRFPSPMGSAPLCGDAPAPAQEV